MNSSYFITCPKGIEILLADELTQFGATTVKLSMAGVYATGSLEFAYRTCLWSRLANRILYRLAKEPIDSIESLYGIVYDIDWESHMLPTASLWIDFSGECPGISNTLFGAQKIKDAIVDKLRDKTGDRPSIEKEQPDIRINCHIQKGIAEIAIDLSGESLHRRGYRIDAGVAPLKENLAAAILIRAGWLDLCQTDTTLIDPMCGSGTFLIEAAMMSADIAPGLLRHYFGFQKWKLHDKALWHDLRQAALARKEIGLARDLPDFRGYDADPRVMAHARNNITRAGLDEWISVTVKEIAHLTRPTHASQRPGLIVVNPPYGERLSDATSLQHLYQHFSERLTDSFSDWKVAIFTGNPDLCKTMSYRPYKKYALFNGTIPCDLLLFQITHEWTKQFKPKITEATEIVLPELSQGAQMVANRLQKNHKKIEKWLKTFDGNCYRIYDADLPEYAVAIDRYGDYFHLQEYAAPKTIDPEKAQNRLEELVTAVQHVFGVARDKLIIKQRLKQKGKNQYQKLRDSHDFIEVEEEGAKFLVNLQDYLDTGLFLDHRPVRRMIRNLSKNKHFLNLFCYTGTASVQAAIGGARRTVSVDMSATYCDWAKRNLASNGFSDSLHKVIQADCLIWLQKNTEQFDLILLDPPTFSNSKRMDDVLDIQRDYMSLIDLTMKSLTKDGLLIFSTNFRQFKLDPAMLVEYAIENITAKSFDPDFARDSKLHHCWLVRRKD
ncbi:MAG: bifunctional 23S rRNA (guanine(2069)-N(7))-methyltransferase RlmK/23S rRNA (guanine(2445)-N(2))-methyltransferase RlmL [Legionellales bacterium]|nr:bifunctional 23S rRNA (guanine(2069)-N(7))-methyltransferase RlmK/23S rRNA (guanine(2445)-N(2))-methyltransferase RlmL [Legionellales bacterium]